MAECYLCGSDLADHGPPVCGPCNEMTARGNHGARLLTPPAVPNGNAAARKAAQAVWACTIGAAWLDALEGD